MIILKYYSIGFIITDLIISMYTCGKEENIIAFILSIIGLVPIIIYLILS